MVFGTELNAYSCNCLLPTCATIAARQECPFGFFYLSATQLVAAAGRGTNHMPPFSRVMDEVVKELPFLQVCLFVRVVVLQLQIWKDYVTML